MPTAQVVTITEQTGGVIKKVTWDWLSTDAGVVASTTTAAFEGMILAAVFVPDTGATAPTDKYSVTITNPNGIDLLRGLGGNRSGTLTEWVRGNGIAANERLTLNVSGAGDANGGTVYLYLAPVAANDVLESPDEVITVTPVCDTNAYASGDLIFDSVEIPGAARLPGGKVLLQSLGLLDKDDQGVALTLVFANALTDFGTLNEAPDPDDTECLTIIGTVAVATTDYVDMGGAKYACLKNIGLEMKAAGGATSLYVACINGTGTPTFTAAGLVLQLGFLRS